MISTANSQRLCVIGAGSSGLAVAKNFIQQRIEFDCFEREDDVGGNWYFGTRASSVYESTHLISSKQLTEYTDFPMPDEYPEYPSHVQALEYLRSYARAFDLYRHIRFCRPVAQVAPTAGGWEVRLEDGEVRQYAGVVIANGHNWAPQLPENSGPFAGQVLHSSQYKTPDCLRGKRVLIVGAGNSGCDIAVEAAQNAACTFHSARRGYHYLPKFLLGKPIDRCGERLLRWRLPLWLRRAITSKVVKLSIGCPQDYGLPAADHRLFESHPIINSQMLYYVGHGKIHPKPDIERLEGANVRFVDGTVEHVDVIIYATGFRISFPFIDTKHLNWRDGAPRLRLNIFHPEHDQLFVAGLIQPDSGQWGLVDCQAQLIAGYLRVLREDPLRAVRFRRRLARHQNLDAGIRYVRSSRHLLEVEHFSYRRKLEKLVAALR